MLRLAQAASSEYFTEYGTPPNQRRTDGKLDGELNVVNFYGGWEYCFRPKSSTRAEKIAWLMEGAVENGSHIGYGQASLASDGGRYPRTGVFDALYEMTKPDPRKIKTMCNCDCSSLVGACVYASGAYVPALRTMWTGTERKILMDTGKFIEITDPLLLELGTGLRRGDILLKAGHTAVAIDTDDHHDTFPVMIGNCYTSRVRSGPGTEYETVEIVKAGTILEAEGTANNADGFPWYRVLLEDMAGYTSSAYAEPLPEGKCTGDTWLRKEPGTKGEQIIVIPKGAAPYLTGATKTVSLRKWYECIYGGHRGWASSLYVKEK